MELKRIEENFEEERDNTIQKYKTADKRKWETTEETIREVNKIRRK